MASVVGVCSKGHQVITAERVEACIECGAPVRYPMDEFGAFADFAEFMVLRDRVRAAGLDRGAAVITWLLPPDVLPGVKTAYGYLVERVDGVEPALLLRPAKEGG